jgi:hypothetical protein
VVSQTDPSATQMGGSETLPPPRDTQQPLVHRWPAQQGAPALPHFTQPKPKQIVSASMQPPSAQQGPPALPHGAQTPWDPP